jgi:glucose dehydrogenase
VTTSIPIAFWLDADTGKMKWYFQFVPHDTHDWDANETPVLVDASFRGRPRKLLLQANRNGYFYVLDRETGEFLSGKPFVQQLNWAKGLDDKGRPEVIAKPILPPRHARLPFGTWSHELVVSFSQS